MESVAEKESVIELEHAIGFAGRIMKSVHIHPNGQSFIYISGACVVVCSISDPHDQHFLRLHDDKVTALAVSSNGRLVASGENSNKGQRGDNADVIVWDFDLKKPLFKLCEHDYEITCLEFSNDSKLLLSCGNSMDKKIFIWDTSNGYIIGSTFMSPDPINCAVWGGFVKDIKGRDTSFYQFATAGNKQIFIWKFDAVEGVFKNEFINTGSTIREYQCVEFSKNKEDYLFAGTSSGDFLVFQMKNKVLSFIIMVAPLGVTSIRSLTPTSLIVGCGNGCVSFYSIENGRLNSTSKNQVIGKVVSFSSHDGQVVLTATDRGYIYQIQAETLSKKLQSENHIESVLQVTYPPGVSDKFGSCSEDGTIRLWDVSEYKVECLVNGPAGGLIPTAFTYVDEVILSGWQDSKIRLYKIEDSKLLWQIDNAHKQGVSSLVLSKNLKFFCSGGEEGDVRVWEMKSREMVSHLKEHTSKISKVQLLDDNLHLVSASKDRALLLWDLRSEKRVSAHIQRMGGINSFAVIPNSATIISTGQDRKITYWDLRQANAVRTLDTSNNALKTDECYDLAASHDGRFFASGGCQQVVRVWDVASGSIIAEEKGHSGAINSLEFSFDDKQIVSGGKDGTIFLWNIFN